MKYSGNMESLASLVKRINEQQKFRLFPSSEITRVRLSENRIVLIGVFCKSIGQLNPGQDQVQIELKVILKRRIVFIGLVALLLLSGPIWSQNVAINGDPNPSLLVRIGFTSIGLALFSIPSIMLIQHKKAFRQKVEKLLR